jgi:hypothetical protein
MVVCNSVASKGSGRDDVVVDFYRWNLSDHDNGATMTMGGWRFVHNTERHGSLHVKQLRAKTDYFEL